MKKTISGILLALVAVFALVACDKKDKTTTKAEQPTIADKDAKDVVNWWCWNAEIKDRVEATYPDYDKKNADGDEFTLKSGKKIKWTQIANAGGQYQTALDAALEAGTVDMFLIEADYAMKYVNSRNVVPLENLKITETDLANQYGYTKDVVTNGAGKIVGSSWQATPGVFMYNVAYAKAILGSDWETEVVTKTKNWTNFDAFAEEVSEYEGTVDFEEALGNKAKSNLTDEYLGDGAKATQTFAAGEMAMLAGMDDMYRIFSNNATTVMFDPVKSFDVKLDAKLWNWVDKTKDYADNGYLNGVGDGYQLWGGNWEAGQKFDGKAFGTFGCPWYVDFCLINQNKGNEFYNDADELDANKTSVKGSWKVTEGPQQFFWGGTWMCVTPEGVQNMGITIKDIVLKMTCDKAVALDIAKKFGDFTNYKTAMNEMAADTDYLQPFMQQNTFAVYAKGVDAIEIIASRIDQYIHEEFQNAMHAYFLANDAAEHLTKVEAFEQFEEALRQKASFDQVVAGTAAGFETE